MMKGEERKKLGQAFEGLVALQREAATAIGAEVTNDEIRAALREAFKRAMVKSFEIAIERMCIPPDMRT